MHGFGALNSMGILDFPSVETFSHFLLLLSPSKSAEKGMDFKILALSLVCRSSSLLLLYRKSTKICSNLSIRQFNSLAHTSILINGFSNQDDSLGSWMGMCVDCGWIFDCLNFEFTPHTFDTAPGTKFTPATLLGQSQHIPTTIYQFVRLIH